MPPRKRAATPPTPEAEAGPEPLGTGVGAEEEPAAAIESATATPDGPGIEPESPAEPGADQNDSEPEEQPCTQCFPAGWPDGATSAGCGHDTWNREL